MKRWILEGSGREREGLEGIRFPDGFRVRNFGGNHAELTGKRKLLHDKRKMQAKTWIHAALPPCTDQFDCIPDSILLIILNKVSDVRALGRCAVVSKRFNALVPLAHDVFVKIDRVVSDDGDEDERFDYSSQRPRNLISHLLKLMFFTLLRPFHNLHDISNANMPLLPQLSHHSAEQVLKKFHHIHNLRIELPAGDVGTEDGVLLKWKAEFGSTLQNCVILGGIQADQKLGSAQEPLEDNGSIPESFYTNGGLKLRVVWTISSLIAASTRHYLLRPIIKDHPTLKNLVLTDADGQGTLSMNAEQLREFREKPLAASASSSRTQVPASNMKLRYAPYLELPEGKGIMQGATLVSIRPSGEGNMSSRKEAEAFVAGAFDGPFKSAVKALLKRRTYLLEMNVVCAWKKAGLNLLIKSWKHFKERCSAGVRHPQAQQASNKQLLVAGWLKGLIFSGGVPAISWLLVDSCRSGNLIHNPLQTAPSF
ncbi:hypothetical protein ACLOJK_000174 [Asimina triloba]